jgi:hypothetical protein
MLSATIQNRPYGGNTFEVGILGQAMNELGFSRVEESINRLLYHLKTISGRLALDALESPTSAAAAVGLGVVTAWLQKKQMLRQAVLIVDIYPRLFLQDGSGKPAQGDLLTLPNLTKDSLHSIFQVCLVRIHPPKRKFTIVL